MNSTTLFALLPDMAVFSRVVDAGNFSEAARQLGSTPSTISRQIKRLDAARHAVGIASLPDFAVAEALRDGDLVQVLGDWEFEAHAYMGPVWLLYPPNRFLPSKVRVLIDHLASHLQVT